MSEPIQPGHPDIEQLSAFAAHALPGHENEVTLAHVAECSHCRHIVFQLQNISVERTTVNLTALRPVPWLKNWKWILPSAALLGSVAVGLFFLENRPTELLKKPSIAPPSEIASTQPLPVTQPPSEVDRLAPSRPPHKIGSDRHRSALPKPSNSPVVDGSKAPVNGRNFSPLIPLVPSTSQSGNSVPESGRQPATMAGGAIGLSVTPAPAKRLALPSGAFAVSSASNGTLTLALDREGNLFLTTNGGETWEQTVRSWNGKAVTITFSGGANQAASETSHHPAVDLGQFVLRTDSGSLWVSLDGTHWTEKTP